MMDDNIYTLGKEIHDIKMARPHCILLGAGASLAAFPNGDAYGRKLPLMNNFIETLRLDDVLKRYGITPPYNDFESLYSDLVSSSKFRKLVSEVEAIIYEYFHTLKIPPIPTMYDYLLLSLRSKDVIATFNWDPFLVQSYARNQHIAELPSLLFCMGMLQ